MHANPLQSQQIAWQCSEHQVYTGDFGLCIYHLTVTKSGLTPGRVSCRGFQKKKKKGDVARIHRASALLLYSNEHQYMSCLEMAISPDAID